MKIIGIDPGTKESAVVIWDTEPEWHRIPFSVSYHNTMNNDQLLTSLAVMSPGALAIEMIASYGMPVGREVFETCLWIGRFMQAFPGETRLVYRKDIKLHFCGSSRAKDANIRQALIDKYGPIGTKKAPGPLYGIHGDEWQALAVALYASEVIYANQVYPAAPDTRMCPEASPLPEVRKVSPTSTSGMLPGRD